MKNTGTLVVTRPSDTEIVLTRVFDAPRRMVFEALTRADLMKRWYGPRGHHVVVCDIDLRVGGAWRVVLRSPEGTDMAIRGVYREIAGPDRMVSTELFEDYFDAGEAVVTTTLTEQGGKTTLRQSVVYGSKEIGDAVIASGMEHGAAETFDRLNELLVAQ